VIIKKKNSEKQNADWSGHFIFRNALKKEEGKKKLCKVPFDYINFFGLFFTNIRCPPITLKKKPISLYKHKMPSNYTKKIRLLFTNTRCSPITLKKSECSLGENKVASKYGLGM